MATITSSEIRIYSDSSATTQVGSPVITQSAATAININQSTLGVALSAGKQYYAKARCTNSEEYTSDWTSAFPFKTLIYAGFEDISVSAANIIPQLAFEYDTSALSVAGCGVYVSTNASGTGAQKYPAGSEHEAEKGFVIELQENTKYYVIPYVVDNEGREYKGSWAEDAEEVTTGYNAPTVTISNTSSTYNSISGNVTVTSNDIVSEVKLRINATGGSMQYKTLTAQTGIQNFTITNGDLDDDGNAITITPSTAYNVLASATNSGGTGTATAVITTAQQAETTIVITSVTDITPKSAVVNLSFGDAGPSVS